MTSTLFRGPFESVASLGTLAAIYTATMAKKYFIRIQTRPTASDRPDRYNSE